MVLTNLILVMLFGMKNAPGTFQKMINTVVSGLEGYDAYTDNVIAYSDMWEQHVKQLKAFLCRLWNAHMTINLVKSKFCQARVVFLGHVVGQGELKPVSGKVKAIVQFPVPTY